MTLYGLSAKGILAALEDRHTIWCGKIFKTEDEAKAYIPVFRRACITKTGTARDFTNPRDDESLKMSVIPFELEGGLA